MSFKEVELGKTAIEIIDGDRGKNYPNSSELFEQGDCLFLSTKNVTKIGFEFQNCQFISHAKSSLLRKGKLEKYDVILTTRGTVGNVAYYSEDVPFEHIRINSGMLILRTSKNAILPIFLYYLLQSSNIKDQIKSLTTGSAQPQLPITSLKKLIIKQPSIKEQFEITALLSSLDRKIKLNNAINKNLEQIAQALFKRWFIDFEFPNENGEPYKSSGGEFEESELGLIPKGWSIKFLEEVIQLSPKRQLKKSSVSSYVEMKSLLENYARVKSITTREFTSGSKFINGDILLARITPCLENGKTAYVDFLQNDEIGWGSTEFIILRSRERIPCSFTYFLARSDEFRSYAISNMTGSSGRQRVSEASLRSYQLALPTNQDLLIQFGVLADYFLKAMKKNDDESSILTQLRDTLLSKLMSGELRVPVEKDTEVTIQP